MIGKRLNHRPRKRLGVRTAYGIIQFNNYLIALRFVVQSAHPLAETQ